MIKDVYALCPEFPWSKPFHLDKGAENQFHIVLAHNIVVRGLLGRRFGLRNQYLLYHYFSMSKCYCQMLRNAGTNHPQGQERYDFKGTKVRQ